MKIYCESLNHWLYHPVDTSLLCNNRALKYSECRKCRGIVSSKINANSQILFEPQKITLDVNREEWGKAVRELKETYDIRQGTKQDETSARRIGILLGELYLTHFHDSLALFRVPIIEKEGFDLAIEYRLKCEPLEREERIKRKQKKRILCTWGVDKGSGVEGYTTQLKDWTIEALFEEIIPKIEEEDYGTVESRKIDFRNRPFEDFRLEEIGIGPS